MNPATRGFLIASLLLVVIFFGSSTLFWFFENQYRSRQEPPGPRLSLFESAYWAVVTLSTVGYGDISAQSGPGKIITIFLIVVGLSIYVSVFGMVGSILVERGLKGAKGLKKCKYEGHVVVLGMNDVVEEAIRQLLHAGQKIAVVVENSEGVDRALRLGVFPVLGDPTQPESIQDANAQKAKTILINLRDDSRTILAALACRKVNKSAKIVASIRQRQLVELVKESGVQNVISPEALTGRMLASAVDEPHVIDFVDDITSEVEGADLREVAMRDTDLVGLTVGQALERLRKSTGLMIVGLVKAGEPPRTISNPSDSEVIQQDDALILLGYDQQFQKLAEQLHRGSSA